MLHFFLLHHAVEKNVKIASNLDRVKTQATLLGYSVCSLKINRVKKYQHEPQEDCHAFIEQPTSNEFSKEE